jgi:hypothetical protein
MTIDQLTARQWREVVECSFRIMYSAKILLAVAEKTGENWRPDKEFMEDIKRSNLLLEAAEQRGYRITDELRVQVEKDVLAEAKAVGNQARRKRNRAHKRAVEVMKVIEFPGN